LLQYTYNTRRKSITTTINSLDNFMNKTFSLFRVLSALMLAMALFFVVAVSPSHAETSSDQQIREEKMRQIETLLATIQQLQAQLAAKGLQTGQGCLALNYSLSPGSSDKETAGEVSKLQRYLASTGHYTYGEITGYYGTETMYAVQRWQAANSVANSGNPSTTGYGAVGQKTRAALARGCTGVQPGASFSGTEMDSILKSADSGRTFSTHFSVAKDEDLGAVDVLTISFNPKRSNYITVSTYDDGLYLKQSPLNQWYPVTFPPKQIYSFIINNKDPDNRAFATGVHEKNGRIYRTRDRGATWQSIYAEPGNGSVVSAITQLPEDPEVIIAGTSKGTLIRSTDSGDTWMNIGQSISGRIENFTHDATKDKMIYLLSNKKIYHSKDDGRSWSNWEDIKAQEIKDLKAEATEAKKEGDDSEYEDLQEEIDELTERNKEEKTPSGIVYIVADPSDSGVLYAGLSKGLYRSTDYGKYWKKINIIESAEQFPIPSIAINPKDSDEISFVSGNSFYRSTNYGSTWAVTPLDKTRNASFVAYDPFNTSTIYIGLSAKK
jgi:type II secretory pathway component PulJ